MMIPTKHPKCLQRYSIGHKRLPQTSKQVKCYEITREVDGGLETLQVQPPAIISTDLRLNEPRFATLPNIMKAKSKPFKSIPIADLKLTLDPYYQDQGDEHPPQKKAGKALKSIDALAQAIQDSLS